MTATRPPGSVPPLRVVHLDHVAALSGGELALAAVLGPLTAHGIDPLVVLGEDGPLVGRLTREGVETRVLPLAPEVRTVRRGGLARLARAAFDLRLLRYVLTLRTLLREAGADVVHTNSLKAALYGGVAGRLAGVPVVWHVRDRLTGDYLGPVAPLVRLLARVLPTAVVANSQATLSTLGRPGRPGPSGRVVVGCAGRVVVDCLPHSFDGPRAAGRADAGDAGDVGEADAPVRVGILGRLAPWKGQDLFLRAFARACGGTGARAVVIGAAMFGDDDYADGLPRLADELGIGGQVEFRGFCEDVVAELGELTVLVHCSTLPEPFGQVVVEGMAAGLPVVAAGEGGPAETISHGRDGLLVAPRDELALAAAIAELVDDAALRARLGAAARVRAADFTPARTAAGLADVLHAAARPRRVDAAVEVSPSP